MILPLFLLGTERRHMVQVGNKAEIKAAFMMAKKDSFFMAVMEKHPQVYPLGRCQLPFIESLLFSHRANPAGCIKSKLDAAEVPQYKEDIKQKNK